MIREAQFAKRVLACREKLHLSQTGCAQLLGVSRKHLNNWEMGLCKPKGQQMHHLAAVLRCDVVWLQHGDGVELERRIDAVMRSMRIMVRDLEHIHRALRCMREVREDSKNAGT